MDLLKHEIVNLLTDAFELGYKNCLMDNGLLKLILSRSMAQKIYGRENLKRWEAEGLITPNKDGTTSANLRYDRKRLEILRLSDNRCTYLTTKERRELRLKQLAENKDKEIIKPYKK